MGIDPNIPPDTPLAAPAVAPAIDIGDLQCPLCGYDLRGLSENRCPECGHAFDPHELRIAKLQKREWLFEHAERRIPRSFVQTTLRSLAPASFWTSVAAAHVIVPRRLTIWAIVWVSIALMTLGAIAVIITYNVQQRLQQSAAFVFSKTPLRTGVGPPSFGPVPLSTATGLPAPPSFLDAFGIVIQSHDLIGPAIILALILSWPVLATLAIRIFATTLRRAGVQRGHLARCTRYAIPTILLPTLFFLIAAAVLDVRLGIGSYPNDRWNPILQLLVFFFPSVPVFIIVVLACITSTVHLCRAHTRYLKLPHALATALLVQTVAWLTIAVALFFVNQMRF